MYAAVPKITPATVPSDVIVGDAAESRPGPEAAAASSAS